MRCQAPGCALVGKTIKGYCGPHYQQVHRGLPPTPVRPTRARGTAARRDADGQKECARCETWLPVTSFTRHKATCDGLQTWCRRCQTLRKYNLTASGYAELWSRQGEGCGICGTGLPGGRGFFHIDHDHTCCPGQRSCGSCVRGILCHACNVALGSFRDDPEILARAAEYVERRKSAL